LFVIALLQLVGVGDMFDGAGDADFDLDADAANGLEASGFLDGALSLLGIGRVPFLIWVASLLLVFTIIGVVGQSIVSSLTGAPFSAGFAGLLAGLAALPANGLAVRPLEVLIPKDETSAIGIETLVRRDATIQTGMARKGSPARSKVIDMHGHPHFVMVEPHDGAAELAEGETVLLVRREGQTFFAVRYESPLLGPE
jgi:hypothetical protein